AWLRAVRGRAVDRDHAAAVLAADGVGDEALAVVHVVDVHLLVLADAGDVEQPPIDGARALVMELGMGHGGPVDLGLEHVQVHAANSTKRTYQARLKARLSIRRVRPSLAATRAIHGPSAAGSPRSGARTVA